MRVFGRKWLKTTVAAELRRNALRGGFNGLESPSNVIYLNTCTGFHLPTGSLVMFSRDVGHHTSGWWKNPDYEQCWHLSLSFRDSESGAQLPRDRKETREWIDAFFGDHRRLLWCEPPYSAEGRRGDVWHYRLFCDRTWTPILPRGEVYSREFTEAGWKSWSDVQAELATEREIALAKGGGA